MAKPYKTESIHRGYHGLAWGLSIVMTLVFLLDRADALPILNRCHKILSETREENENSGLMLIGIQHEPLFERKNSELFIDSNQTYAQRAYSPEPTKIASAPMMSWPIVDPITETTFFDGGQRLFSQGIEAYYERLKKGPVDSKIQSLVRNTKFPLSRVSQALVKDANGKVLGEIVLIDGTDYASIKSIRHSSHSLKLQSAPATALERSLSLLDLPSPSKMIKDRKEGKLIFEFAKYFVDESVSPATQAHIAVLLWDWFAVNFLDGGTITKNGRGYVFVGTEGHQKRFKKDFGMGTLKPEDISDPNDPRLLNWLQENKGVAFLGGNLEDMIKPLQSFRETKLKLWSRHVNDR